MANVAKDITLSCQTEFTADQLVMHYTVTNRSQNDVYILDVSPTIDLATKEPITNLDIIYLGWEKPATAHILKGIMPLPVERRVMVRLMPIGAKLPPQQELVRTFKVNLPLQEQSPYYLPVQKFEEQDFETRSVSNLLLTVQFVRSIAESFAVTEAPHGPDLYAFKGKYLIDYVENMQCESPMQSQPLLVRKGPFARLEL